MDLFGNYVDNEGSSIGMLGQKVDVRDYFLKNNEIQTDKQRDEEYTRLLSERIIEEFHKFNEVLPSHIVGFVAYLLFRKQFSSLDLYSFLRLPEDELILHFSEFKSKIRNATEVLYEMEKNNKVLLAPEFDKSLDTIVETGLNNLGMYHAKRPLLRNQEGDIITQDLNLLYFYHNRLVGYNLDQYV
jgi:glycerol-3-phosphate O-acyltransferase